MNATHKWAYHFHVNCLNGFRSASARDKHYEYCSSNVPMKVKMPSEKEKWTVNIVRKNIQLWFIDSCRFMASSFDWLPTWMMINARTLEKFVQKTNFLSLKSTKISIWTAGRIWRNKATIEKCILQKGKRERYHWSKLWTSIASLE